MKKIISLLSLVLLLSCSSDDSSSSPETGTQGTKLTKIVETNFSNNFTSTTNFTYSGDNLVKTETVGGNGSVYKSEYSYENNKLIKVKFFLNGITASETLFNYTGNLITSSSNNEDGINFTRTYEYSDSNYLIKETQYSNGTLQSVSNFTIDTNGNVQSFTNSSFSGQYNYMHDNKNNPYSTTYAPAYLKSLGKGYTANNIIKETSIISNSIVTYEYVYSSEGFPIEKIEKMNGVPYEKTVYIYN